MSEISHLSNDEREVFAKFVMHMLMRTPHAIEATIGPFLETAKFLEAMNWTFFRTSPDVPFVTSDSPVVKQYGFADANCTVSIPLSSVLAFFADNGSRRETWIDMSSHSARHFNLMTLRYATQMVIASRIDYPGYDEPFPFFYTPVETVS